VSETLTPRDVHLPCRNSLDIASAMQDDAFDADIFA